jgi:hypothetical protein
MEKTKKALKELSKIAEKYKTFNEEIIDRLEEQGFKKISFKKWAYSVKGGGVSVASVLITLDNKTNEMEIECNVRDVSETKKIMPQNIKDVDEAIAEAVKNVKRRLQ